MPARERGGMSDPGRTPEQVAADDALTAAVEACLAAYGGNPTYVLMEYIVVATSTGWDDDGEQRTAVGVCHRDGDVPLHRCLGLAEYAATRYRATIAED
jgi:hypothetical protein